MKFDAQERHPERKGVSIVVAPGQCSCGAPFTSRSSSRMLLSGSSSMTLSDPVSVQAAIPSLRIRLADTPRLTGDAVRRALGEHLGVEVEPVVFEPA